MMARKKMKQEKLQHQKQRLKQWSLTISGDNEQSVDNDDEAAEIETAKVEAGKVDTMDSDNQNPPGYNHRVNKNDEHEKQT